MNKMAVLKVKFDGNPETFARTLEEFAQKIRSVADNTNGRIRNSGNHKLNSGTVNMTQLVDTK